VIRTVPASLDRARALVGPATRRAVARLHPGVARVAGYHAGFADAAGRPVEGGGGKAVRPALALLSAEAVRAPADLAVPGAVAVELVHDFSLLHDDVMDRDRERRHRPAAWALFGEGPAILAGDGLVVLAHQVLLESGGRHSAGAVALLAEATQAMIAGQADDLEFERRSEVSPEDYRRMVAGKTGALLSCASAIGAALAGAPEPSIRALRAFGLHLGMAFQAVDDALGIWGATEVTGKPVGSDLRRRKQTLPVVVASWTGGRDAVRLRELMATPPAPDGAPDPVLGELTALVESAGGEAAAHSEAERHLAAALAALDGVHADAGVRAELEALARFVVEREA
jgi:geranylgeranyl diphosphate synthase, type I